MQIANLRHAGRTCLSRANEFLADGDELSLRNACLELRFAIEYITYSQLQAYIKEISHEGLKKWTPKQLISEMLEVDPAADQSVTISSGLEDVEGTPPATHQMKVLGTDFRFSMKWAHKSYNTLGSYLHVPTLYQIEMGNTPHPDSIRQKAAQIANECDKILKSSIFRVNFGHFLEFQCHDHDCKKTIRRRVGSFTLNQGLTCNSCGAEYDVKQAQDATFSLHLRISKYKCLNCETENVIGKHRVSGGALLGCTNCNHKMAIEQQFVVVPIQ